MPLQTKICISIVSHGQGDLVKKLLFDLDNIQSIPLEVILTINIKEDLPFNTADFGFPIRVVVNAGAKGFAANHNAAFRMMKADYFCVLNPDVRIDVDPFPCLLDKLMLPMVGVAAPVVINSKGEIEDSARKFPTPAGIVKKLVSEKCKRDYEIGETPISPDWVAGMFMMFRSEVFCHVGGFDEGYFLYYEDADLCWRLGLQGYKMILAPSVRIMHHARRESHRNYRYLRWHISSMLRFFAKRAFARIC